MNFLDILILIFLVFFLYRGYKRGIVSEAFQIAGLVTAFYLSSPVSDIISKMIIANYEIDEKIVFFVSGILAFIVIILVFLIIGKIVTKALKIVMLSLPNKIFGAIFGVIKGFFIVTLVILVLRFTPFENFVYDNIEYDSNIDNAVNKIEKVITEEKEIPSKDDSKVSVDKTKENAEDVSETVEDISSIEFTSNKSTLGYLAFKLSTLLDPIATNIKAFFVQKVEENVDLIDNIKEIIPNTKETKN